MSAGNNPTRSVGAHGALPIHHAMKASVRAEHSHWRLEHLTEACGVLADIAHHTDTLVLLASQVICTHSPDSDERADALGVMHLLNVRSPEPADTIQKGGSLVDAAWPRRCNPSRSGCRRKMILITQSFKDAL
jgi:hypothetical protein